MKVFISHSRQNGGAALKLCDRLKQRGFDVWLDVCELEGGEDWNQAVAQAIESADAFVVLVGPQAASDPPQRYEWLQMTEREYYLDPNRPIVPVVLGQAELPGFLKTRQVLAVGPMNIDFDLLAQRVADALGTPEATIDKEQLERGRAARDQALESLKEYSLELERDDLRRAGLRGLK